MSKAIIAIHGYSGAGKSTLLNTAPGPRLTLDAEGGTKWLGNASTKTEEWDPAQPLPTTNLDGSPINTETTVPVMVRHFDTLKRVLDWGLSGQHYFESINWDSITEIQARCKKALRGGNPSMTEQLWGRLLDDMVDLVAAFRDLTFHPAKPVNVFMSALSVEKGVRDVRITPDIQGALSSKLPQYLDVEDRIFGPFTLRQFLFAGGGLGGAYALWTILPSPFGVIAGLL